MSTKKPKTSKASSKKTSRSIKSDKKKNSATNANIKSEVKKISPKSGSTTNFEDTKKDNKTNVGFPGLDFNFIVRLSRYSFIFALALIVSFFVFNSLSPSVDDPDPENISWITYQNNPLCGEVKDGMTIKTFTVEYNNKFQPRDCTELPVPTDQEISPIYVVFYDLKDDDGEFNFINIKDSLGLMSFNTAGSIINKENYPSLEADFNRMTNVYLDQFKSSSTIEEKVYQWNGYELFSKDSLAEVNDKKFLVRTIMIPKFGTDQGFFVFSIKQFEEGQSKDDVINKMNQGDVERIIQSIDLGLETEEVSEQADPVTEE
jgi:hypothetical protein